MSDSEEIERIRQQKRDELLGQSDNNGSSAQSTSSAPTDPVHVNGADQLTDAVESYEVVLVEFHADWCGPCRMMEPALESIAADRDAAVVKIDVDTNQALAAQYQVRGVPTMLVFKDGELAEQLTGARDQNSLETLLSQYGG